MRLKIKMKETDDIQPIFDELLAEGDKIRQHRQTHPAKKNFPARFILLAVRLEEFRTKVFFTR